ncbi:hypothetical protein [Serratia marcescens]|uniref:hypothetical protein n=1 Tax=Serratia marcescens TaxID=615 RepID=UPI0011F0D330|nr:hypothetical protein [Serratia marcescens]
MEKQIAEYEAAEFLHIFSTGHLTSPSVSGASLQYALTRLSKLTAKPNHFVPRGKQHNRNIAVRGKAGDGMRMIPN